MHVLLQHILVPRRRFVSIELTQHATTEPNLFVDAVECFSAGQAAKLSHAANCSKGLDPSSLTDYICTPRQSLQPFLPCRRYPRSKARLTYMYQCPIGNTAILHTSIKEGGRFELLSESVGPTIGIVTRGTLRISTFNNRIEEVILGEGGVVYIAPGCRATIIPIRKVQEEEGGANCGGDIWWVTEPGGR